ncbi:MAG: roadblock/LC7 domain-containing protein [Propionibacteriaceae bacterium]|nr:roadblock/LC7 domain-containing protein [Propionibacteriaceae bacterium]
MSDDYSGSTSDALRKIVQNLDYSMPELRGVMIASADGLPVAHNFPASEAERIAAMAATAIGLGGRIADRADLGPLAEAVVRGSSGYLVVYALGETAVLVLAGPADANLGLMRIEARKAASSARPLLEAV